MNISRHHCNKCDTRIPKHRPLLTCSNCLQFKHYSCNNLSKNEAFGIINSDYSKYWTCQDCMTDIFPNNIPIFDDNVQLNSLPSKKDKINRSCVACGKTVSDKSCSTCDWCLNICHRKCIKGKLGCTNCCTDMIPGYHYNIYELHPHLLADIPFSYYPYDSGALFNLLGDRFDTTEEQAILNDISEQLIKCKYVNPNYIKPSKNNELKVMSLNIRSLFRNIDFIRENITHFNKFDTLLFNETNCDASTLPNGLNDLKIDEFYPPIFKKPHRASNKGGGIAIYINKRVCSENDFETLDLGIQNESNVTCEYLLLKLNIKLAKNTRRTIIIGGLYRSPSAKPEESFEKIEQILSKFLPKTKELVGNYGET